MQVSSLSSLALAGLLVVAAGVAAVTPASATESRQLSDSAYLAAARCAGLAAGLGSDAAAFNKVVDDQSSGREPFVAERAATTRDDAARQAKHAGPDMKAHLTAERDGACQAYAN